MSGRRSVMSAVPQRSVLGPILIDIFNNDIDSGVRYTFSKFADETKLWAAVNTPEGQDGIQRNLGSLKQWAYVNLMHPNKVRCKGIWVRAILTHEYRLEDEWIKSSPMEKDLGGGKA